MKTLCVTVLAFFGRAHLTFASPIYLLVFAAVCLSLLIVWRLSEGTSRVTLYLDHIEKKTWFGTRSWRRGEVGSAHVGPHGELMLAHQHHKGNLFIVPTGIERDANWDFWMKDIPERKEKPSFLTRLLSPP